MKKVINNITINTVVYTCDPYDTNKNIINKTTNAHTSKQTSKKPFVPSNPRAYFMKAISLQRNAFKEDYAIQKLEQSCDALIRTGFCSGCRECDHCALQLAHEETLTLLKVPSIVEERRKKWVEKQKTNNSHTGFGTRVWKSSK